MISLPLALVASVWLAASANDPVPLTPVEFAAEYHNLIGKAVRINGGFVVMASDSLAVLSVPGVFISLQPPWFERSDLRYILNHCTGVRRIEECRLNISGWVVEAAGGTVMTIKGVNFGTP